MNKGIIITRPLCFFDLETTGTNTNEDKIVQIGVVKLYPSGKIQETKTLINPGMPIPHEATAVHGITDEMVKDAPMFEEVAVKLKPFMTGCDIAGYNSDRFDVPLLHEEFARASINFPEPDQITVDAYKYECFLAPRDLTSVHRKYTGKELQAHDALADTQATLDILVLQCESASKEGVTIEDIVDSYKDPSQVDWAGKLYKDEEGVIKWKSGKHIGESILKTADYIKWFLGCKDMPNQTKRIIRQTIQAHNEAVTKAKSKVDSGNK